jgi:hypothetical protein
MGNPLNMKKILCLLASAALLGACEQRTVVEPATGTAASPVTKTEHNTTIVNPTPAAGTSTTTTTTTASPAGSP